MGNSSRPPPGLSGPSDHPRMRGEQSVCMTDHSTLYGSSPYAWGTGSGAIARHVGWRIIPVCVGNRQLATVQYAPTTDHPRMRGEQFGVTAVKGDQVGSSPYAWGTQFLPPGIDLGAGSSPCAWGTGIGGGRNGRRFRIIPVRVGNRVSVGRVQPGQRIIPVRVGNRLRILSYRARRRMNGSSPRGEQ